MPKGLNEYRDECHLISRSKGWHDEDKPKTFGDDIALIHSELSEALEDFRTGADPKEVWYEFKNPQTGLPEQTGFRAFANRGPGSSDVLNKPCGIPSELADVIIRIMDMSGKYGIDIQSAVEEKMAFNATRPQRHGGKKI